MRGTCDLFRAGQNLLNSMEIDVNNNCLLHMPHSVLLRRKDIKNCLGWQRTCSSNIFRGRENLLARPCQTVCIFFQNFRIIRHNHKITTSRFNEGRTRSCSHPTYYILFQHQGRRWPVCHWMWRRRWRALNCASWFGFTARSKWSNREAWYCAVLGGYAVESQARDGRQGSWRLGWV